MFNVSPTSALPGFRVNPLWDEAGFRVQTSDPTRYGFADADGANSPQASAFD